ncbi:glucosaminidase domain-containing protein [Sulfurimonas sp.]|nr:glucosaminidase domain-containing protein [Sulfurimonas sp.]
MKNLLLILTLLLTTLSAQTVQEKKANFISIVAPAVEDIYKELDAQYKNIKANIKNPEYSQKIANLKKTYKATSDAELLMALKPHPRSIAIAQAAMESAWATSRFFRDATNIFGVWSFNKNEPRIAAGQKRGKKTIWLKKYSDVKDSIRDYYKTLARSHAFKEFRALKMKTDNPHELVKKLDRYSEMGSKYGKELSSMIRYNKFYKYDK